MSLNNPKPALVVTTTSFPIQGDGSEAAGSFVLDICNELAKHTKLTVAAPGPNASTSENQDMRIVRFTAPFLPLSLLNPINPRHWLPILATMRAGQACLEAICKDGQTAHILCLWALPCGYWARKVKWSSSIPYSTWALGSDIWTLGKIPLVKAILRSVLREADHRFADGFLLKDDVERISGFPCEFVPSVRSLPIMESKQLVSAPPYCLSYLGRWHPNKGIDLFLDALLQLPAEAWLRIREVRICGGGPLQNLVETQVAKLQSNGRPVKLGGYLNKDEAAQFLYETDYLVLPSRIESIPVIFSDSLQAGCPLIASPVGDLPRLMRKYETGVLSASPDVFALTEALQRALAVSPKEYEQALTKARLDFSVERAAINLLRHMRIVDDN